MGENGDFQPIHPKISRNSQTPAKDIFVPIDRSASRPRSKLCAVSCYPSFFGHVVRSRFQSTGENPTASTCHVQPVGIHYTPCPGKRVYGLLCITVANLTRSVFSFFGKNHTDTSFY